MDMYELNTNYDAKQSFYGKAHVIIEGNKKTLRSYNTNVAEITKLENGECDVKVFGTYSDTTLRHIKEFLKQEGFVADSKKQIEKDYINAGE